MYLKICLLCFLAQIHYDAEEVGKFLVFHIRVPSGARVDISEGSRDMIWSDFIYPGGGQDMMSEILVSDIYAGARIIAR